MNCVRRLVLSLCIAIAFAQSAWAAVYYIDDSATGMNNGSSWTDAFISLHAALQIAQPNDEVRIGQGTYKPAAANGNRTVSFTIPSGVVVKGGYAGTGESDPDANNPSQFETILSGDLNADDGADFLNYAENSYHVVTVIGAGASTQIHGLTIRGGNANFSDYSGDHPHTVSGAIACLDNATPTLVDCTLRENQALAYGGAMKAFGVHATRCSFIRNRALDMAAGGAGGALRLGLAASTLVECVFESNHAENYGGSIHRGVGVQTAQPLRIEKCLFSKNKSDEAAGAIAGSSVICIGTDFIDNSGGHAHGAISGGNSTYINCRFLSNAAACYFDGGSAMSISGNSAVINCLFSGNFGGDATLYVYPHSIDDVLIANCTFVGNQSSCEGAAIIARNLTTIANSIIWNNSYDANASQSGQVIVTPGTVLAHNVIQGWTGSLGGTNNAGHDPLLLDPDGEDKELGTLDDNARLSMKSPCLDAGHNQFLPADEFDIDVDGNTAELLPLDLDWMARIEESVVDIGPYEGPANLETCDGDVAPEGGNGIVNVHDMLTVISNWGPCEGESCAGDVTNNGMVDVDDLLVVINNWGDC